MNLKSIYLIKIDFINRVGDVEKFGPSNQIAIIDLGRGWRDSTWSVRSCD